MLQKLIMVACLCTVITGTHILSQEAQLDLEIAKGEEEVQAFIKKDPTHAYVTHDDIRNGYWVEHTEGSLLAVCPPRGTNMEIPVPAANEQKYQMILKSERDPIYVYVIADDLHQLSYDRSGEEKLPKSGSGTLPSSPTSSSYSCSSPSHVLSTSCSPHSGNSIVEATEYHSPNSTGHVEPSRLSVTSEQIDYTINPSLVPVPDTLDYYLHSNVNVGVSDFYQNDDSTIVTEYFGITDMCIDDENKPEVVW